MVRKRGPAGRWGFLSRGHDCPQPSPELGQDNVTLDSLLRIRENTGEAGAAQGGTQLLQHQGSPQLGASAPVLPAHAALPQPAWEVLNEGTIAQPVEDAEVMEAVSGTSTSGKVTSNAGHRLAVRSVEGEEG